ncbi:MAG: 2OG-Fe(II) oxygenase family protein [Phenylobacterium sp.]
MPPTPKLAGWIDPAKLAPIFRQHGRLHLPEVFETAFAKTLGSALADLDRWERTLMLDGTVYDATLESLAEAPPDARPMIEALLAKGAAKDFQFEFDNYRLSDLLEAGMRRGGALQPLEAVYDDLNSETFLRFIRALTGDQRAAYCDAQATRYRAGHFLNTHDDEVPGKGRLFAYVLNMTPVWRTDWGGLLLFQDADGHVSEGYTPRFNALNIFRVPQQHCVSQVASYVSTPRLAITGWIRTAEGRPKPG